MAVTYWMKSPSYFMNQWWHCGVRLPSAGHAQQLLDEMRSKSTPTTHCPSLAQLVGRPLGKSPSSGGSFVKDRRNVRVLPCTTRYEITWKKCHSESTRISCWNHGGPQRGWNVGSQAILSHVPTKCLMLRKAGPALSLAGALLGGIESCCLVVFMVSRGRSTLCSL